MLGVLKQTVRRSLRDVFGVDVVRSRPPVPPASFEEGWTEERQYWLEVMRDFYASEYSLNLHPLQSDSSLVPPLDTILTIQSPSKANPDTYFATGYRATLAYQTELRDYGFRLTQAQNILELGVGVGRMIIHYFPFNATLHGCDVTPEALAWARSKLSHRVQLEATNVEPPLPYPDGLFDFVYANSVFTHVPCSLMDGWAAELHRIIRPGGFLIFSVMDPNHYIRNITYRDFHHRYQAPGCYDWDRDKGVWMMTYLSREFLYGTWGKYFSVLELRQHYREQSHVICRRDA